MLEKFSNKVKEVIGAGVLGVAAGLAPQVGEAQTTSGEKIPSYTPPKVTNYKYDMPQATHEYGILGGAEREVLSRFATQLKEKGFDSVTIQTAKKQPSDTKKVDYTIEFKSNSKNNELILQVTADESALKSRYTFEDFILEAVAKELAKK